MRDMIIRVVCENVLFPRLSINFKRFLRTVISRVFLLVFVFPHELIFHEPKDAINISRLVFCSRVTCADARQMSYGKLYG